MIGMCKTDYAPGTEDSLSGGIIHFVSVFILKVDVL